MFTGNKTKTKSSVTYKLKGDTITTGHLVIRKTGELAGNKQTLAGFKFKVYYMDGTTKKYVGGTYTTDSNGQITINNLNVDYKYYIEEIEAPEGYEKKIVGTTVGEIKSDTVVGPIEISKSTTTTVELTDSSEVGNLNIIKVDKETREPLTNVSFIVQRVDNGKYVKATYSQNVYRVDSYVSSESEATTFDTNKLGEVSIYGLQTGEYKVTEVKNDNYGYICEGQSEIVTVTVAGSVEDDSEGDDEEEDTKTTTLSTSSKVEVTKENEVIDANDTYLGASVTDDDDDDDESVYDNDNENENSGKNDDDDDTSDGDETVAGADQGEDNTGIDTDTTEKEATSNINDTSMVQFYFENLKQTGNLFIHKQDPDSLQNLSGVSFKIKDADGKYIKAVGAEVLTNADGKTEVVGVVHLTDLETVDSEEEATTFTTDSSGYVKIYNILIGDYTIVEVSVGDDQYGYELDKAYVSATSNKGDFTGFESQVTVERQNANYTTTKSTSDQNSGDNVFNQRKYIKLSGYVWEDVKSSEKYDEGSYDHIYTDGRDNKLNGVVVSIKDSRTGEIVTTTDTETGETKELTAETSGDGSYLFEDIIINDMQYYYIEFEYDGKIYTTTKSYNELDESTCSKENSSFVGDTHDECEHSKAVESSTERQTLDNKYSNVTDYNTISASRSGSEAYGYVRESNEKLTYETTGSADADATATYKQGKKYESDELSVKVSSNYEFNKITATTKETDGTGYKTLGYDTAESVRKAGIEEVQNRNCGLIEREQVDLSVMSDLQNAIVKVNNYTNTYTYNGSADCKDNDTIADFRIEAKTKRYGYTRTLYAEDILVDEDNSNEITTQMWVTYKYVINNNSTTLSANVSELANYHDSRLTIEETTDADGKVLTNVWNTGSKSAYGDSYKDNTYTADYTTAFASKELKPGESATIYVKYKLSNDAVREVLTTDEDGIKISSIIEINGYYTNYTTDTYYHSGTRTGKYASIDSDSAPGDIKVGDTTTYEDDTATSPLFAIKLSTETRTITGNVFEDTQTSESAANNERLGDGKYDSSTEGSIGGVKVELLCYDESKLTYSEDKSYAYGEGLSVAQVYNVGTATTTEEQTTITNNNETTGYRTNATMSTGADGTYTFTGIIPDEYILRFTYADGNVIYKAGSTTEVQDTIDDVNYYKSTIITSDSIKQALNNNQISGDGSTRNGTIGEYASEKWYNIDVDSRYSDAIDSNELIAAELNNVYTTSANGYTMNGTERADTLNKQAYSGVMNIQVELEVNEKTGDALNTTTTETTEVNATNADGTPSCYTVWKATTKNVDFGIIEKARENYDITKEISHVKVTLANGQVLIDGDPSEGLQYVKDLSEPEKGLSRINIEIDEELLYGSTLEVTYKITVNNNSEAMYLTDDYYRYGEDKDINYINKLNIKVIDYLDKDMEYQDDGNTDIILYTTNGNTENKYKIADLLEQYISDETIRENIVEQYPEILVLENMELEPKTSSKAESPSGSWKYVTSRVLSTSDDLEFVNNAETMSVTSSQPPTESTENGGSGTPNSVDPTQTVETLIQAKEDDNYISEVILTTPTGDDRSYTAYIVGTVALVVLAGGIFIIKRFVLRPKK